MRSFVLAAFFVLVAAAVRAQAPATPPPPDVLTASEVAVPADGDKTASGLVSKLVQRGSGTEKPASTDIVTVHYTGWSSDGTAVRQLGRARNGLDVSAGQGHGRLARVRAADDARREAPLLGAGEPWPTRVRQGGRRARCCSRSSSSTREPSPLIAPPDVKGPPDDAKRTPTGLAYKVLRPGKGVRNPSRFGRVTVHYTGWTTDGRMFDSSVTQGQPRTFRLDDVIKGWTEGVPLMVEGERMRFWVPENLAYGGKGDGPRGMLVFDIELIRIEN